MGTQTTETDLTGLDDVAFMTAWAATRDLLLRTPMGSPYYKGIRDQYDAVVAEYHHRVDGWI